MKQRRLTFPAVPDSETDRRGWCVPLQSDRIRGTGMCSSLAEQLDASWSNCKDGISVATSPPSLHVHQMEHSGPVDGATQTTAFAVRRENAILLILIAGLNMRNYQSRNAGRGDRKYYISAQATRPAPGLPCQGLSREATGTAIPTLGRHAFGRHSTCMHWRLTVRKTSTNVHLRFSRYML